MDSPMNMFTKLTEFFLFFLAKIGAQQLLSPSIMIKEKEKKKRTNKRGGRLYQGCDILL